MLLANQFSLSNYGASSEPVFAAKLYVASESVFTIELWCQQRISFAAAFCSTSEPAFAVDLLLQTFITYLT